MMFEPNFKSLADLLAPTFDSNSTNSNPLLDDSIYEPHVFTSSPYWNVTETANHLKSTPNAFTVFSINSQSIRAKFNLLKIFIHELDLMNCSFSAICIQESWLDDNTDTSPIILENYTIINQPCRISKHSGLLIYLRKDYNYKTIKTPLHDSWEDLFIEITRNELTNILLGNIYRPPPAKEPTSALKKFTNEFSDLIYNLSDKNTGHQIVVGDYNIDLLKSDSDKNINNFLDSLIALGLVPKITHPTRYSDQHGTGHLIDNAFVKTSLNLNLQTSAILTRKLSDHLGYLISLNDKDLLLEPKKQKYIKINSIQTPEKLESFNSALLDARLMDSIDCSLDADPENNYKKLINSLENLRQEHFPTKTVRFNNKKHGKSEWITTGIINSVNFRDKLYKRFMKTTFGSKKFFELKTNLDNYKNILRTTIRNAKTIYYSQLFERCKNNLKMTWKAINDVLNRNKTKSSFPDTFQIDGKSTSDRTTIVNAFNNFFIGIGEKLALKMDSTNLDIDFMSFLTNKPSCRFEFEVVNEEFISKCIDNLKSKNSSGYDHISSKLLKASKNSLSEPLTVIINQSLKSGIFPDLLKIAKVVPIFKKGNHKLIDNYRPISLLPAISKVFEKVMHHQLFNYFSSNNLLYANQYGFRTGHSTEHASLELLDRILQKMEIKDTPFSIFIDLSKAFDTLNHEILLKKLSFYGLNSSSLNLFRSYLTNRKQYVLLDDDASDYGYITTGVPQGSILGPLLFLIYINDIVKCTSLFNVISYADDTTLTSTINQFGGSTPNLSTRINKELMKVQNWLLVNKLALNIEKTKYMIFHKPNKKIPKLFLKVNDVNIDKVSDFTFLGLTIDENITWKAQILKVGGKIAKVTGIMSRLKNFIPSNILLNIYNALILPHLNYSLLAWGYGNTNRIFKLQKRAIRIICNARHKSHTQQLFASLNLLTIDDIFLRLQLKFYYQLQHQSLPAYFDSFSVQRHEDVHTHNTRHKTDVRPLTGKKYTLQRIRCSIITILRSISNSNSNSKFYNQVFYTNMNKEITKPKALITSILEKVDTHSISGFCNYIKIKFIELYANFSCKKTPCFSCNRK